jgi:putative acyl-CoA dehydrogenase
MVTSRRACCRGSIREAPVNAIWEGSGNVMCLDVLRALARDRDAARAVLDALASEAADLPGAREAADFVERAFSAQDAEARARAGVGRLALLAAAAALRSSAPPDVAELFARTRLSAHHDASIRNRRSRCRRNCFARARPCRRT